MANSVKGIEKLEASALDAPRAESNRLMLYIAAALLGALLIWAYRDAAFGLWIRWWSDPAYGHGFFVPLFSLFLLWYRSKYYEPPFKGTWWGIVGILIAFALKFVSGYWYYALLDPLSIVPMALGLCLLILGWKGFRWYAPSVLFLVFMVPLPGRVADMLSQPLQRVATIASTFLVQLVGIPAVPEGNVIVLTHAKIGVIEACNGLKMLILFVAVASAVAILINKPLLWRLVILASAIPVALIANILRITFTALAFEYGSANFANSFFHELGGWLMMPLGILLLYFELLYLERAFPMRETQRPVSLT